MANKPEIMTMTGGNPVADNQNSITVGPRGTLLMQDYQLLEKLAHQNRERIPERTVHAKGTAAYGTLTIRREIVPRPPPSAVKSKCLTVGSWLPAHSCRTLTTLTQNSIQPT